MKKYTVTYEVDGPDIPKIAHEIAIGQSIGNPNIRSEIEKTLNLINSTLSNWDPNSEITKLNNNKKIGTIKISNYLKEVLKQVC